MNPGKRAVAAVLHAFEHKETHAFHVRFDGRLYYVCARCSGLYLGVALGFPLVWVLGFAQPLLLRLGDVFTDLICLSLALPTIVDWCTQRLALRESTNRLRFVSAFLAGTALAWYLLAAVTLIHKVVFLFVVLAFISLFSLVDRRPQPEPGTRSQAKGGHGDVRNALERGGPKKRGLSELNTPICALDCVLRCGGVAGGCVGWYSPVG